jgi:hypothetical protein
MIKFLLFVITYKTKGGMSCSAAGRRSHDKTLAPIALRHHFSMVLPFRILMRPFYLTIIVQRDGIVLKDQKTG